MNFGETPFRNVTADLPNNTAEQVTGTENREQPVRQFSEFLKEEFGLEIQGSYVPDSIRAQLVKAHVLPSNEDFHIKDRNDILDSSICAALARAYLKSQGCDVVSQDNRYCIWQPDGIVGKKGDAYVSPFVTPTGSGVEVSVIASNEHSWNKLQDYQRHHYQSFNEDNPDEMTFEDYVRWVEGLFDEEDTVALNHLRSNY